MYTKEEKAAYDREYRERNRERLKAIHRQYRETNRDAIRAMQRAWEQANKDRLGAKNHQRHVLKKQDDDRRCIDCGGLISYKGVRCKSCATKDGHKHGTLSSPEVNRRHSETMKRVRGTDSYGLEWQRKVSEAQKKRWTPEERALQSERMKLSAIEHEAGRKIRQLWAAGRFDHRIMPSPTSIEIAVDQALDYLGLRHKPQYRPAGCSFIYDQYVEPNILLEVNGRYWHADSRLYPEGTLNDCQIANVRRDNRKLHWAEAHGFVSVTIWELDIKDLGAVDAVLAVLLSNRDIVCALG